jgi:hypothetical protein
VADVVAAAGARLVTVALAGMDDASRVWADIAWTELTSSYPELDLAHVGRQIVEHYRYGQQLPAARRTRARARIRNPGLVPDGVAAGRCAAAAVHPYPAPCFTDDEIEVGEGQFMHVFSGGQSGSPARSTSPDCRPSPCPGASPGTVCLSARSSWDAQAGSGHYCG